MAIEDLEAQAQDQAFQTEADTIGLTGNIPQTSETPIGQKVKNFQYPDQPEVGASQSSFNPYPYDNPEPLKSITPPTPEEKKQQFRDRLLQIASPNFLTAQGVPVEQRLRAKEIGAFLEVPDNLVVQDLKTYEAQYAQKKFNIALQDSDALLSVMVDPKSVDMMHDDIPALSNFTQFAGNFGSGLASVVDYPETHGYAQNLKGYFDGDGAKSFPENPNKSASDSFAYQVGSGLSNLPLQLGYGAFNELTATRVGQGASLGGTAGSVAGSIVPGAGTTAGVITGGLTGAGAGLTVGIAESMSNESANLLAGEIYQELTSKGVPHEKAFVLAKNSRTWSAPINTALETASNLSGVGRVVQAVFGQTRKNAAKQIVKSMVIQGFEEGTVEALQSVTEDLVKESAKYEAEVDNIYDNPTGDKFSKIGGKALKNFGVGAIVGTVYTGTLSTVGHYVKKMVEKAPEAIAGEQTLINSMDSATQTLTHARDPITFNTLAQTATDGKEGHIDREIVIAQAQADPELWKQIIPDLEAKIAQSEQTGEAISFPLGNWITYGANNEQVRALSGDVRFSPDGATANEVRAGTTELPDDVKAEIASTFEKINGQVKSPEDLNREWVKSDILKQITQFKEIAPADRQAFAELFTSRKEAQAKQNEYRNGGVKEEYLRNPVVFQSVDTFNADTLARQVIGEQQVQEGGDNLSPPLEDIANNATTEPTVGNVSPVESSSDPLQLPENNFNTTEDAQKRRETILASSRAMATKEDANPDMPDTNEFILSSRDGKGSASQQPTKRGWVATRNIGRASSIILNDITAVLRRKFPNLKRRFDLAVKIRDQYLKRFNVLGYNKELPTEDFERFSDFVENEYWSNPFNPDDLSQYPAEVRDLLPVEQFGNTEQLPPEIQNIPPADANNTPPYVPETGNIPANTPEYTQETGDLAPPPLNTLNQSANARIVMDAAKKVIQLFKGRGNVSSLIHEMGHLTLDEFIQDATTAPEGTSQQLKTDYETTKQWWKDSSQYLLDLHTKRNMFGLKKDDRAKELEKLKQINEQGGVQYLANLIDNNLQVTDELSKYAYTIIHELTARGTEVYVMEGKAPNKGLARVFERFKKALTDIYETFSRLNAPLSDEMREVFGRLLSAEQTQAQATKDLNLEPMFPTQEASGMSKAEYNRYREKIADNTASLSQKLLKKAMKALRVQKTKEGAEKLESITARLEKESRESKPIETYEWLSNSNVTIDPTTVVSAYGKDAVKLFPKELLSKEGISLQTASEGAGYAVYTDFADDLKRLQQMRANLGRAGAKMSIEEARQETVKRQAEQELKDWASPESLYDEAIEDIHNSGYEEALTTELNTLSQKGKEITGESRFPDIDPASLKEYVKDLFSRTPLQDILKKNKYLNAERRAGNKAQRHLLDGNYELAYASKREQIVSHLMYKEALAFEKSKAKADRLFNRIAKEKVIKGVNHDSMAIMHRILQDQGYKTARSQRPSRQGYFTPELEQYFTDKNGNTLALNEAIDEFLKDDKTGTRDTIYISPQLKQGTPPENIRDFQALFDTIQSIFEHGKAEQELYLGGKRQNFIDTVNKIVETGIEGRNLKSKPARASRNSLSRWQELKEKTSDRLALIPASVVRASTIFNRLDQYQHDGNLTQLLNRMQDGLGKFLDYSNGFKQSLKSLEKSWGSKRFSKWRNSLLNDRIENDLLGDHENNAMLDMYKSDLIAIALNRGTADSFRKLVEGRAKREDGTLTGWTAENVDALLDRHMTKEDWEAVQMLWKEVGKSWDDLNALSKRLNGWGLDKTVEIPIQTKFGIIEGGYYPLLYDDTFRRVATAEEVGQSASFGNALDISALKNRSERVVKPVSLRFFRGLEKAQRNAYGLYLAESWRDMSKVLSHPKVKKMIVDVQGEPAYNALIDMMEEAKSPNRQNASMADYVQNWGNHLHAGGVIVNFAYAIKPMFDAFSEFFVAPLNRNISKLGYAKNLGKVLLGDAFLRLSRNPDTEYAWARQFDAVKALDQSQQQRWDDFSGQLNKRWLVSRGLKHVSDFGFTLLELTSKMTSTAIARTAYEGFVNKHPEASQTEIADFVNKVVRDTHISRNILDTPLTQRNKRNSHLKWFMTFSLKMINQVMDMFYESKDAIFADGGKRTKLERTGVVFKNVMMGMLSLMIPQISYMYLSNKMAEDDDGTIDWVKSLLFSPFQAISSGFPVLRDFADILFTDDPFAGNNLDSRYRSFGQAVKDAKKLADSKNEYGIREVNTLLRLFGTVSHAPVRPIMYGEYLYGLNAGDIQYNDKGLPATIQDIQRGYQP